MSSLVPIHLKLALSVPEAAALVGLSEASIRRFIADGTLPRVPHTERVLIARSALEAFVQGSAPDAA